MRFNQGLGDLASRVIIPFTFPAERVCSFLASPAFSFFGYSCLRGFRIYGLGWLLGFLSGVRGAWGLLCYFRVWRPVGVPSVSTDLDDYLSFAAPTSQGNFFLEEISCLLVSYTLNLHTDPSSIAVSGEGKALTQGPTYTTVFCGFLFIIIVFWAPNPYSNY